MGADRPPAWFVRQAALLLVFGAIDFLVVAMILQGLVFDSFAPQVPPWDESKWVPLATHVIPSAEFETLTGATPEEVVGRLGPPVHVNRGWRLPDDCAQSYLYVQLFDGRPSGTGVCFSHSGRVVSFVGGYDSPIQFDYRGAEDGLSADTLLLVIPAGVLAIPFAAGIHLWQRRQRRRRLSIA